MNRIKQHKFGEIWPGEVIPVAQFSTTDELLAVPFVANYVTYANFHRFSVSRDSQPLLMAEYEDGKVWYVVGYLDSLDGVNLPTWHSPTRHQ